MIDNSKVMVTGSDGFIGSNLVRELKKRKAHVTRVDITRDIDIMDRRKLSVAMVGVKYVFHMAVLPYGPCSLLPRKCIDVNIIGTLNVLKAACEAKVKKVVYSSASAVYGNIDFVGNVDERQPLNAESLYGASKIMGELLVRSVCEANGIDYVILRYMNVYGSGQKNGLIPALLNCVADKRPPVIYGDGRQAYDFVNVRDVVRANVLAAESDVSGEAFNIGGGNDISVNEVVRIILKVADSDMVPTYEKKDKSFERRVGSSLKAKRLLGYEPLVKFNEGIGGLLNCRK